MANGGDQGPVDKNNPLVTKGKGETVATGAKPASAIMGVLTEWGVFEPYTKFGFTGLCLGTIVLFALRFQKNDTDQRAWMQGQLFGLLKTMHDDSQARELRVEGAYNTALSRQWENQSKITEAVRALDMRSQLDSQKITMLLEELRGGRRQIDSIKKEVGAMRKDAETPEPAK